MPVRVPERLSAECPEGYDLVPQYERRPVPQEERQPGVAGRASCASMGQAMLRGEEHDIGAYMAPDITYHTSWITPQDDHTDTLHAEGEALGRAFRDVDVRVDRMVAEGDFVTAHWSASVHHHGTFPHAAGDIAPTGRQMEVGGLTLYHLRDGKIADIWVYSNLWDAVRSGALA